MPQLSEKAEGLIVGAESALGAIATGVWTLPVPNEAKAAVSSVAGLAAVVLYAFWYGYVNKKQPTPTQ